MLAVCLDKLCPQASLEVMFSGRPCTAKGILTSTWRPLWPSMGGSWGPLGRVLKALGCVLEALGGVLGAPGAVWEAS